MSIRMAVFEDQWAELAFWTPLHNLTMDESLDKSRWREKGVRWL